MCTLCTAFALQHTQSGTLNYIMKINTPRLILYTTIILTIALITLYFLVYPSSSLLSNAIAILAVLILMEAVIVMVSERDAQNPTPQEKPKLSPYDRKYRRRRRWNNAGILFWFIVVAPIFGLITSMGESSTTFYDDLSLLASLIVWTIALAPFISILCMILASWIRRSYPNAALTVLSFPLRLFIVIASILSILYFIHYIGSYV